MKHDLAGKNAEVIFETGYHFSLAYSDDGETLTYVSLRDEDNGKTKTVPIVVHKANDGIYSVAWHEVDGTTVAQLLT